MRALIFYEKDDMFIQSNNVGNHMKIRMHTIIIFLSLFFACIFAYLSSDILVSTYYHFNPLSSTTEIIIDESGVPIVDYGYKDGIYIGKQRYAITISHRGLYYYDKIYENDTNQEHFLNCANWLVNNSVSYDNYSVWETSFAWPNYNLTAPWVSGMAQGLGIQVLLNAYELTGDQKYLDVARSSLNAFYVNVSDGGVTYKDKEGWWYEEYAMTNNTIEPRVLNGFMYALIGINEYYEQTKDERARYLFEMGINDLKCQLDYYDTGRWTYYDHLNHEASGSYHQIHIELLNELYEITGDSYFKDYCEKWTQYDKNPLSIINKMNRKVFLMYFVVFIFSMEGILFRKMNRK